MSPSNKRKAPGAQSTGNSKMPRPDSEIAEVDVEESPLALFKANKLVYDLKESQLRVLLVQAYLSHPPTARAIEVEHEKMEHLDAQSDAGTDAEMDDVVDEDWKSDPGPEVEVEVEVESEAEVEVADKDRKVTQIDRPGILEDITCSCKSDCGARCKCVNNASSCAEDCKCDACANLFNPIAKFFEEPKVRLTQCFASYYTGRILGEETVDLESAYELEELRSTIMGVDPKKYYDKPEGEIFYNGDDEEIKALGNKWLKSRDETHRKPVRDALFRKAFLEDGEHFYSFCTGDWENFNHTRHCPDCDQCYDWRYWHCKKCDKCQYGHSIPCDRCGGVSEMYHDVPRTYTDE